jgi:hypothetical protein
MVESEWSIIIFSKYFKIQFAWPTFQKRSWTVIARSCNKVGHLFWFTILAQHETNNVILYIHSVHKHRGNSFQRQNYKMRLKQRSLNWINSLQVKKILYISIFFFQILNHTCNCIQVCEYSLHGACCVNNYIYIGITKYSLISIVY